MDAIYKTTREQLPLYAVTVADEMGHTWPIALALLSEDTAESIGHFLATLCAKMEKELEMEWTPAVMTDKSAAQMKAIRATGWAFFLCDFHVQQAWRTALRSISSLGTPEYHEFFVN